MRRRSVGSAWQAPKLSFHVGQRVKLCWHRVCLWSQLTELTDGSGQQCVLRHHAIVRLAGWVCRTVLMHCGHTALDCGKVVKMAIFCKRQQFIRKFGWRIFFIQLLSLVRVIALGWAIYNNKERLPWSILIMYLQIKHKTEVTTCLWTSTSFTTVVSFQLQFSFHHGKIPFH